ncbi:MAG: cation transporter [Planctomycetes bacterium]|nr:cation transporter [Planctomycetota bacterium]
MLYRNTIAAALTAFAGSAQPASAQVERVTLRFDGLACPFCVYNVEKQVKKIDGVDRTVSIENDLKRGLIWFAWDPGRPFNPETVRAAAGDSGFTLREIRVHAAGDVRPTDDPLRIELRLADAAPDRRVAVVPDSRLDRREAWDALSARAADGEKAFAVRVEGTIEGEGPSSVLVLHGWSPLEYGAVVDAEVEGFACERCSTRTMKALRALDGVIHAQADHETGRVRVWTTSETPDTARIREGVENLGFSVKQVHAHRRADTEEGDG